jgi:hypothetical protein
MGRFCFVQNVYGKQRHIFNVYGKQRYIFEICMCPAPPVIAVTPSYTGG